MKGLALPFPNLDSDSDESSALSKYGQKSNVQNSNISNRVHPPRNQAYQARRNRKRIQDGGPTSLNQQKVETGQPPNHLINSNDSPKQNKQSGNSSSAKGDIGKELRQCNIDFENGSKKERRRQRRSLSSSNANHDVHKTSILTTDDDDDDDDDSLFDPKDIRPPKFKSIKKANRKGVKYNTRKSTTTTALECADSPVKIKATCGGHTNQLVRADTSSSDHPSLNQLSPEDNIALEINHGRAELRPWSQLARQLNERISSQDDPSLPSSLRTLTASAVYSRYIRDGVRLKSMGESGKGGSSGIGGLRIKKKRQVKPTPFDEPRFTSKQDECLAKCVETVQNQQFDFVAQEFFRETGLRYSAEQCEERYKSL